jgi:hypothetical protein
MGHAREGRTGGGGGRAITGHLDGDSNAPRDGRQRGRMGEALPRERQRRRAPPLVEASMRAATSELSDGPWVLPALTPRLLAPCVVLCQSANTNNERDKGSQANKLNQMPKEDKKRSPNSVNSQKPIPFTSGGRPPFIGRRTDFLHTEITLV